MKAEENAEYFHRLENFMCVSVCFFWPYSRSLCRFYFYLVETSKAYLPKNIIKSQSEQPSNVF